MQLVAVADGPQKALEGTMKRTFASAALCIRRMPLSEGIELRSASADKIEATIPGSEECGCGKKSTLTRHKHIYHSNMHAKRQLHEPLCTSLTIECCASSTMVLLSTPCDAVTTTVYWNIGDGGNE